jgi:Fe-S-cluster containining protein
MDREQRLAEIVSELGSDERYATGQRRFSLPVSADDAAEIAEALMAEVDLGVEARARAAANKQFACKRGCNACCEELIMVWLPEAMAVARWLGRPQNAEVREHFLAAYPRWRPAVGDAPERIARAFARGNAARVAELHIEQWQKRVMCAFNRDGDCTVYAVRPAKCRTGHAIGTNEHCYGDDESGVPAARLSFPPLDDYVDKARTLLQAAHIAVGGAPGHPWALCEAVHGLLTGAISRAPAPQAREAKVGRNAPCPCGSGKKYKRCCGRSAQAG